ncbi:MAG: amidohydrolase family protein [Pseudomonadota bacterium]
MNKNRRQFLEMTTGLMVANFLSGCCLVKKPSPRCPFDPGFVDPEGILAIDVHAHIFNAHDLQVKDFVSRVAVRQSGGLGALAELLGGFLQTFAWAGAPSTRKELEVLRELRPAILACETEANVSRLRALRQQKYAEGRKELQKAAQKQIEDTEIQPNSLEGPIESLSATSQGLRQILDLPETYDELFEPPGDAVPLERKTPASVLKFVIEMFQYRYVSAYNYLDTYSGGDVKVDLMTPAVVDFDWWISEGSPTPSRLPHQMELMKEIAVLTGGRVHAFVPFDPFRQVVNDLGLDSGFSPIELVRQSISDFGAVGIKLYPPMGFAPYGNEEAGAEMPDMWSKRSWLTDVARRSDFGRRLDESMAKLYEFCAEQDVPIMGHSNESNGPAEDFEKLTAPKYWETAIDSFPDVSFCFGHFGGVGSENRSGESNVEGFLRLLKQDLEAGTSRVSADASYFSNVLDRPSALQRAIEMVYSFGTTTPTAAFDRLMYGADWKMLAVEADAENYLRDFNRVMLRLEETVGAETRIRQKFFGQNASRFLGLQRGSANRSRLEAFYDRNGITAAPSWMGKVDDQVV